MPRRKIIPLSANAKPSGGLKNLPPPNPMQDMADVQEARSLGYDFRSGMIDMGHLRAWLSQRRVGTEPTPNPRIIGDMPLRLPGEIEAETAEFIDRAAKLIRYHASHGRVSSNTKLGDLMALVVEPSGKPLGEMTWPEMEAAHWYLTERAQELNTPFQKMM